MLEQIRNKIIVKLLVDGFKQIEKTNWMTQALNPCFKQHYLRSVWNKFLDSVEGILNDAKDEVKQARTWTLKD